MISTLASLAAVALSALTFAAGYVCGQRRRRVVPLPDTDYAVVGDGAWRSWDAA